MVSLTKSDPKPAATTATTHRVERIPAENAVVVHRPVVARKIRHPSLLPTIDCPIPRS